MSVISKWLRQRCLCSQNPWLLVVLPAMGNVQNSPSWCQRDAWAWWGAGKMHKTDISHCTMDWVKGSLYLHCPSSIRGLPCPPHKISWINFILHLLHLCPLDQQWHLQVGRAPSQCPVLTSPPRRERKLPAIKGFARLVSHDSRAQGIREQMLRAGVTI